jgi:hypothetical protein
MPLLRARAEEVGAVPPMPPGRAPPVLEHVVYVPARRRPGGDAPPTAAAGADPLVGLIAAVEADMTAGTVVDVVEARLAPSVPAPAPVPAPPVAPGASRRTSAASATVVTGAGGSMGTGRGSTPAPPYARGSVLGALLETDGAGGAAARSASASASAPASRGGGTPVGSVGSERLDGAPQYVHLAQLLLEEAREAAVRAMAPSRASSVARVS